MDENNLILGSEYKNPIFNIDKEKVEKNLQYFKNLKRLDFDSHDIVTRQEKKIDRKDKKRKLMVFESDDYNIFSLLVDYPELLKDNYIIKCFDRYVGKVLDFKCDGHIKKVIKTGLINNFAEMGLILAFSNFCINKKILINEFEPNFLSKQLDLEISLENETVLLEAYAPMAKITESRPTIGSLIEHEVEEHNLQNTQKPIILLFMINNALWGRNSLNGGKVSDFMFSPAKVCIRVDDESFNEDVSAVILKRGNIFTLHLNKKSKFPISKDIERKLINHTYVIRIIEILKYYWTRKMTIRNFLRLIKNYPEYEEYIRQKGSTPKEVIENYLNFTDNYPF